MPETPQSRQTKIVINQEEARTELLATLAAARELGPDMDETLASRYVERLDVLFPDPARDSARIRGDVEALLVSVRGHGADADPARVKDFVARALAPQPAPLAPVPPVGPPAPRGPRNQYLPAVIGLGVIIAIAIATRGEGLWLMWLVPAMFWGMSRGGRRRMRYRRYGAWDGYGPTMPGPDLHRQLPPNDGPEIL